MGALTAAAIFLASWSFIEIGDDMRVLQQIRLLDLQQSADLVISDAEVKDGISEVLLSQDITEFQGRYAAVAGRLSVLEDTATQTRFGDDASLATGIQGMRADLTRFRGARLLEFSARAEVERCLIVLNEASLDVAIVLSAKVREANTRIRAGGETFIVSIGAMLDDTESKDVAGLRAALGAKAEFGFLAGAGMFLSGARNEPDFAQFLPAIEASQTRLLALIEVLDGLAQHVMRQERCAISSARWPYRKPMTDLPKAGAGLAILRL